MAISWSLAVRSSVYLGVTINDHLTWNDHIQNTITSAKKIQLSLEKKKNKTKQKKTKKTKKKKNICTKDQSISEVAYKTLVRPVLEYLSPVWSPTLKHKSIR